MIREHPLFQKLLSLRMPPEDYVVFGSAPMFVRGLKDLGHDLDVVARGKAWDLIIEKNQDSQSENSHNRVISLFDGEIEIFNGWFDDKRWTADELIDTAEIFEGIRFVTLDKVILWKQDMGREKDLAHIKIIEDFMTNQGEKAKTNNG